MKITLIIASILATLFLLGWLGLQIKPAPFSPYPEETPPLETVPLTDGLPAPVERFYKTVYGDQIPVIETAVIKGRAVLSPFGPKMPARFIFVHNAGKDYRHYIEATWFGLPVMKVDEGYVDGESFFESPMGNIYNDASTNQAANLAVWAEAGWFPSIWLTDERARWEAVDEKTALLFVPFEDQEENFVVRFNPETGLIDTMEAMRYRDSGDQAKKVLWITTNEDGEFIEGTKLTTVGSVTWLDQGKPWATFTLEEVNYNVDVNEYIRQRGE
ncbi:MAG: hypothetical protein JW963_14900 [Anaerolineales bacterium]|nr:hypothetical protein [Anaerolineales bacterium]